jgi:hypothetical protein
MDKVRFGRALGTGAREAAKALLKAADAAAAPDPSPAVQRAPAGRAPAVTVEKPRVVQGVAQAAGRVKATRAGLKEGSKRFGAAAWAPLAKAGAVLWLEVTGVLFGLFAAVAGVAVWQDRGNFRVGGPVERHAWLALGMFAVFAYFTVTSYVRAARRGKR